MAEYGEWNRKGAILSDVTAKAEYRVNHEFIIKDQKGNIRHQEKTELTSEPEARD